MICRLPEARPGAGLAVPEVPLRHRNWARHRTHTTHAAADPSTDSPVEPVTKLVRADSARAATASSNDGDATTRRRASVARYAPRAASARPCRRRWALTDR